MCALIALAGSAYGQTTWQQKSRLEQARTVWGVDGTGVQLGQIELAIGRRSHEGFALGGGGDRIDFTNVTVAANTNDQHATQVAGIMGGSSATFTGAAPGVHFQWADWTGTATLNLDQDFLNKMNWFLTGPIAPIVNMSAGIRANQPGDTAATIAQLDALRDSHQRLADWAADRGLLFVAAAGNDGRNGASSILSPASGFNVLTVGGTGNFDRTATGGEAGRNWDQVGTYSSQGPVNQPWSGGVTRTKPDLVAPGFSIQTTDNTADNAYTNNIQGTSFAAPQVSGAAALLYQFAGANADGKDAPASSLRFHPDELDEQNRPQRRGHAAGRRSPAWDRAPPTSATNWAPDASTPWPRCARWPRAKRTPLSAPAAQAAPTFRTPVGTRARSAAWARPTPTTT